MSAVAAGAYALIVIMLLGNIARLVLLLRHVGEASGWSAGRDRTSRPASAWGGAHAVGGSAMGGDRS
jgi:hypothetical protein